MDPETLPLNTHSASGRPLGAILPGLAAREGALVTSGAVQGAASGTNQSVSSANLLGIHDSAAGQSAGGVHVLGLHTGQSLALRHVVGQITVALEARGSSKAAVQLRASKTAGGRGASERGVDVGRISRSSVGRSGAGVARGVTVGCSRCSVNGHESIVSASATEVLLTVERRRGTTRWDHGVHNRARSGATVKAVRMR